MESIDDLAVEGSAVVGSPGSIFAVDVTEAESTCASCGATSPLADEQHICTVTTRCSYDARRVRLCSADRMPAALVAGRFHFANRANQVLTEDGQFEPLLPLDHRANYVVRWIVSGEAAAGRNFAEVRPGTRFEGRYQ